MTAFHDRYELSDLDNEDILFDRGYVSIDSVPHVGKCNDAIYDLIEAVYATGNISVLEMALEDLADQYGINVPKKHAKIDTLCRPVHDVLHAEFKQVTS